MNCNTDTYINFADRQTSHLAGRLLGTGGNVLAECAVNDCVWGIGLSMGDGRRFDKAEWKGQNLLGYALMMARADPRG